MTIISKDLFINEKIRSREVRLIDADGEQLGIKSLNEALKIAREQSLDLVNVAPTASPPVCRIMDFGKFKYEQSKKDKESKKNQKTITVKEVKLRPNIEEHDFNVKVKNVQRFLEGGDKVKVTIMFRGREVTHAELGRALCERVKEVVSDTAVLEKDAKLEGRNMIMILGPKS